MGVGWLLMPDGILHRIQRHYVISQGKKGAPVLPTLTRLTMCRLVHLGALRCHGAMP